MHFRIGEVLLKIPPIRDINETGRNMCIKGHRHKANRKQKSLLVKKPDNEQQECAMELTCQKA